jgi:transcriptional regulator NrdR family protein
MTCLYCGGKTKVIDTGRSTEEVIRRRKCLECGKLFFTAERDISYNEGRRLLEEYKGKFECRQHKKKSSS